jgi:hypothetical protein
MSADWSEATCVRLGVDPDTMQPEAASADEIAQAIAVCEHCPLWNECRDLAESQFPDAYGVHAGKWWGPKPASRLVVRCQWCGTDVETDRTSVRYCGPGCRMEARNARRAVSA